MTTRKPTIGDIVSHKCLGRTSTIFDITNNRIFIRTLDGINGNYPIDVLTWNTSTNQWEMT